MAAVDDRGEEPGIDVLLEGLHAFLGVARNPDVFEALRRRCGVDLTWPEIDLLRTVGATEPPTIPEIARAAHRGEPEVARMVLNLQHRGYVVRRPDRRDRRVLDVVLTARGREADRTRGRMLAVVARETTADWPPDEVEALGRLFHRYALGLASALAEPAPPPDAVPGPRAVDRQP